MPYQTPITIKVALDRIWTHDYVLPAIQREFVWKPGQITLLFDSLMQGFPVGSFLFWKISPETSGKFRFFDFVRQYHQRDHPHCPPLAKAPNGVITAILDGQQRLTALNIGLRGSMAIKLPYKWWNNPDAFPTQHLYLNLLHAADPEDVGQEYSFQFLTEDRASQLNESSYWFKVTDIFEMPDPYAVINYLAKYGLSEKEKAVKLLSRLHQLVHVDPVITFYEEESQDIEKVLSIFIRTNSGGTVLSYSDLLLSIASAQWENRDARSEIHTLVDEINQVGAGFDFSKDFILKAGLMLSDISSVGFKVENFGHENMVKLEENWPKIADTLRLVSHLAASFGLSRDTIRADSALLPIAYYLHRRNANSGYLTAPSENVDRATIKHWLIRSLIKPGVWGSGLDVLLTALRDVLRNSDPARFPVRELERAMRARGRTLTFTDEEIADLVDIRYGNRELFGIMTLLFPFIDTRNRFHIDHVYPRAAFHAGKLKAAGMDKERIELLQELKDRVPNLQLLEGSENQAKQDQLPTDWLNEVFKDTRSRDDYIQRHKLGTVGSGIEDFTEFYNNRRLALLEEISVVLNGAKTAAEEN